MTVLHIFVLCNQDTIEPAFFEDNDRFTLEFTGINSDIDFSVGLTNLESNLRLSACDVFELLREPKGMM